MFRSALGIVVALCCAQTAFGTGPFLKVAPPSSGTNLVRNAAFETRQGGVFPNWSSASNGYRVAEGEGRSGSIALACETTNTTVWCGASQTIPLNRTNVVPLVLSGWSKAEAVSGGTDSDYSLYVDILYQDGTPLWGQTAQFSVGTHDWQQRQITIYPEKPVKNLTLHCLFRNHSGKVWFDDLKLEELTAQAGAFIFQGTPMVPVP